MYIDYWLPAPSEDEYKDPDLLPEVNKADIAGTMESIEDTSDHVMLL